ncbi:MAG: ATP-binding protein [Synergistaceae bacterium]|jgi:hypothetical protein|nr:ATP-binding protein [Synergistaceae bacterium]
MSIQDELRHNNPFSGAVAPEPGSYDDKESVYSDAYELNSDVAEAIFDLLHQKSKAPAKPLSALVLGDAGSGKTHMLERVRRQAAACDVKTVFTYIRAFTDSESVNRHLWREIFLSLVQKSHNGVTQLDIILDEMLGEASATTTPNVKSFVRRFQSILHGICVDFLKALFAYRYGDEDTRLIANTWLDGTIDDEQLGTLNVRDRGGMTPVQLETEAQDIIKSWGMLLAHYGYTMLVCFDQLEGMKDHSIIEKFGFTIDLLVGQVHAMLPLTMFRPGTWSDFSKALDTAARERLSDNRFTMTNCRTIQDAENIIEKRLVAARYHDPKLQEILTWLRGTLAPKYRNSYTPRMIISIANDIVREKSTGNTTKPVLTPIDMDEVIDQFYNKEIESIESNITSWLPDASQLFWALKTFFTANATYSIITSWPEKPTDHLWMLVICDQRDNQSTVFIMHTNGNSSTARAAFSRANNFWHDNKDGRVYYITDHRCPFKWTEATETGKQKQQFMERGGKHINLEREQLSCWFALWNLHVKIQQGDVFSGMQTADNADFEGYMQRRFKKLPPFTFNSSDDPGPVHPSHLSP